MATTQAGRRTLLTPRFRVSFPEVFVKKAFQEGQTPRFSLVGLFQGFGVTDGVTNLTKLPKEWSQKERDRWNAILAACNKASIERFKKPMDKLSAPPFKLPLHRGEEKEYGGYGPGVVFFTMASSKRKPGLVNKSNEPITLEGEEEFYAGCWARASVNPYAFDKIGKGIAIGLGNVQKLDDGERLDAFTSAEDDFGDDPNEYSTEESSDDEI